MSEKQIKTKSRKGSGKQSFLHGALILTLSVFIVKVIGMLFKVPLNWIVQEDGMGYFGTAYNFYGPIFSLATAGFPIAISKMVAEHYTMGNYRDVRQIHRASVPLFLFTGSLGMLIMFVGAAPYTRIVENPLSYPAMLALAPAILFSCLSSIYRGYYEGLRNMYPTAVSEIIEALGKLLIGLSGAYLVLDLGMKSFAQTGAVFGFAVSSLSGGAPDSADATAALLPFAAAAAIFGVTFGSLLSFGYLLLRHRINGDGITKEQLASSPEPASVKHTVLTLVKTAIPIAIGAVATNISSLIDTTFLQTRIMDILETDPQPLLLMYEGLIPQRNLQNLSSVPNFLFGCYANAVTIYMLIPSITQAFGISALPSMTAAWTSGVRSEIKKSMESVLRITALFSIPAGIGVSVMAVPIAKLIFGSRGAVEITGYILMLLGIAAIFASISTPLNSMLQAVGRMDLPVKILCIGLLIKILCTYVIAGIPEFNVLGAGIGTILCYAFSAVTAIICLCRITGIRPSFRAVFGKPLLAALLCGAAAYASYTLGTAFLPDYEKYITLLAIGFACVIYAVSLLLLKGLSKDDVLMLPKGEKIAKVLEKRGWIR